MSENRAYCAEKTGGFSIKVSMMCGYIKGYPEKMEKKAFFFGLVMW